MNGIDVEAESCNTDCFAPSLLTFQLRTILGCLPAGLPARLTCMFTCPSGMVAGGAGGCSCSWRPASGRRRHAACRAVCRAAGCRCRRSGGGARAGGGGG